MAKKISVINFKGGVGKTTLSLHLAAHLSVKYRVLLIDIDHQSSLSIAALGGKVWDSLSQQGKTINSVLGSFARKNGECVDESLIVKSALNAFSPNPKHVFYKNLDMVASQFELDDTEIDLASTTIGNPIDSEWQKRALISEWLDNVDHNYDYIIFDCPPATKIVSQNALAASDYYVVPVIPDEMSSRGVTHFKSLVERKLDTKLAALRAAYNGPVPRNYVPKTEMLAIVPSMVKVAGNALSGFTNAHTEQLGKLRYTWGDMVVNTVIKNLTGVTESMDAGWPVWVADVNNANYDVKNMMTEVCNEIEQRLISYGK